MRRASWTLRGSLRAPPSGCTACVDARRAAARSGAPPAPGTAFRGGHGQLRDAPQRRCARS